MAQAPRPKTFTLDWHKDLGWSANPFTTENLEPADYFICGLENEQQKLNYFIIEGQPFGTIISAAGMGKSQLLKWLRYELGRYRERYRTVLIDCERIKDRDFIRQLIDGILTAPEHALIKGYYKTGMSKAIDSLITKFKKDHKPQDTFYRKIARGDYTDENLNMEFLIDKLRRKPLILILDNAAGLPDTTIKLIRTLFDRDIGFHVVCALTPDQQKKGVLNGIGEKDQLKIEMHQLAYPSVREMIKRRIEFFGGHDIEPFHDVELASIWDEAGKNPKKMLDLCSTKAVRAALKRMKERPVDNLRMRPSTHTTITPKSKQEKIKNEFLLHEDERETTAKTSDNYQFNVVDRSTEPLDVKVIDHEPADFIIKEVRKPAPKAKEKKK